MNPKTCQSLPLTPASLLDAKLDVLFLLDVLFCVMCWRVLFIVLFLFQYLFFLHIDSSPFYRFLCLISLSNQNIYEPAHSFPDPLNPVTVHAHV